MIKNCVVFLFCLIIAVIDVKKYLIPDILLLILSAFLLIYDIFYVPSLVFVDLLRAVLIFIIFYLIYRFFGGLGFGDVKLISILAFANDFYNIVFILLSACVLGLLYFLLMNVFIKKNIKRIALVPFLCAGEFLFAFLLNIDGI